MSITGGGLTVESNMTFILSNLLATGSVFLELTTDNFWIKDSCEPGYSSL